MENEISNLLKKYSRVNANKPISSTETINYTLISQNPKTREITLVQPCNNLYKVKATYRK